MAGISVAMRSFCQNGVPLRQLKVGSKVYFVVLKRQNVVYRCQNIPFWADFYKIVIQNVNVDLDQKMQSDIYYSINSKIKFMGHCIMINIIKSPNYEKFRKSKSFLKE